MSARHRKNQRTIRVISVYGHDLYHASEADAQERVSLGHAREIYRRVHGKPKEFIGIQLTAPDRKDRHSACSLTRSDMLAVAWYGDGPIPGWVKEGRIRVELWPTIRDEKAPLPA